jgi:hypothetical protein
MTYAIYEGNLERLRKKVETIKNKCRKYGCDFHFEEVGEEIREVTDEYGHKCHRRFVIVEAEGEAVVNGWRFVATLEHRDTGNVIHSACNVEVPRRFYNHPAYCEHCRSLRMRKDTFIVMNESTGEFKQVGRSCLKDFTSGMSVAGVASYMSLFEDIIEAARPSEGFSHGNNYYRVDTYLKYAAETVRHFGYTKRGTADYAFDAMRVDLGMYMPKEVEAAVRDKMLKVGFNAESPEAAELVNNAIDWLKEQTTDDNYTHNLRVACLEKYDTGRNFSLIASLFPTFNRELEYKRREDARRALEGSSKHVGTVGMRITVKVRSVFCVTSWETQYGTTYVYKITSTDDNIFTWKTSKYLGDGIKEIVGTIKEHTEFRGVKQTELTRCKVQ